MAHTYFICRIRGTMENIIVEQKINNKVALLYYK